MREKKLAEMRLLQQRLAESQAEYEAMGSPPVKREDLNDDNAFLDLVGAFAEETKMCPMNIDDGPVNSPVRPVVPKSPPSRPRIPAKPGNPLDDPEHFDSEP